MSNDINETELMVLREDPRKGVQLAIINYEKRLSQQHLLKQSFQEMMSYEYYYHQKGKRFIAGIDEVGRGPLAGPVVAAAVILPIDFYLLGITDSKKLSKKKREYYCKEIKAAAISYAVGVVDNDVIDEINIYQATIKAMKEAVANLDPAPDHLLIDAVKLPDMNCSYEAIIKGDQKSISIAAASIVAKVTRDKMMAELHQQMPTYHFDQNQGYGTEAHLEAIKTSGATKYHRKSFAPIKDL